MKDLVLFRHAKSSWANPGASDFDRPLNKRGRRAAPMMAAWLAGQGWAPDLVLCSAARRTQETLALVQPHLGAGTVVIERALYLATVPTLRQHIARIPDGAGRALVIGHNPGLELLAAELDPGGSPASEALARKFPTAAMAWFRSPAIRWTEFDAAGVVLVAFKTPADLGGPDDP